MEKLEEKVYEILEENKPIVNFHTEKALIDGGVLDSFDIISIVNAIDEAFDIEINLSDLEPENFNSAEAICELIKSYMD